MFTQLFPTRQLRNAAYLREMCEKGEVEMR